MLTEDQKTTFRKAVDFWNGDESGTLGCPLIVNNDEVVTTREGLGHYVQARASAGEQAETPWGVLYIWRNVQAAKGLRRGTQCLMDFGEARAVYFDGEVPA